MIFKYLFNASTTTAEYLTLSSAALFLRATSISSGIEKVRFLTTHYYIAAVYNTSWEVVKTESGNYKAECIHCIIMLQQSKWFAVTLLGAQVMTAAVSEEPVSRIMTVSKLKQV